MASTADTPRARQLGAELRALRTAARMTSLELAKRLGRSHSHISRWEHGKLLPNENDTAGILGILGVTGEERERLLALARDAADPNWIAPGMERHLAALLDYERTATRIVNVEALMIPGLLQIAEYAGSIMIGAGATRGEADQRVMVRMGRRDVLTRRNPVDLYAIIGEHALRYPPCDRAVMVDQLHHLLQMSKRSNVTIRALPFGHGYSPALEGPFVLFEFDRAKPVVQMEHYRSAATITDAKDVRDYQAAVATLGGAAMGEEATSEFIARLADEMEREI